MTPQQVELVQTSFKKVVPIAATAADLFYNRLFEIAPETRALFPADMTQQKSKLMAMLATAVTNLHQLDTILPAVKELGKRHKGYGVTEDQYAPVWTLEKGLGPDWTPELQAAWMETYTALAGVMANA
jgi:hemoglobin-like flavoprotein